MTDQAIRVVPAGWYEDPASNAHVRWWNGLAWTEHTAARPAEPPRQQPAATAGYGQGQDSGQGYALQGAGQQDAGQQDAGQQDAGQQGFSSTSTGSTQTPEMAARIAEARALERQYGISTEEHDIIVRNAHERAGTDTRDTDTRDTIAASGYRPWDAEPEAVEEPRIATASSWFIALWPVLTLVAALAAAYVYFYVSPEPAVAGIPVVAAVVLVPSILMLVWAVLDARKLRSFGHRPASPALAFLGPLVYLIARRTRVTGSGPLVTLIILTVLAVGGPIAAVMTGAAVPVTKAAEIQQTIREDLVVGSGELGSVSCPEIIESVAPGEFYTCDATLPDGSAKLVWVSIDSSDGTFSYALAVK